MITSFGARAVALDQAAPYVQHQPMILARLDGSQHEEVGLADRVGAGLVRGDAGRETGDRAGWCGQAGRPCLLFDRIQRRPRVRDEPACVSQCRADTQAMHLLDAGTAIFRVSQGNQVVDHEHRPSIAAGHGSVVACVLHAGMAGMKQDGMFEACSAQHARQCARNHAAQRPAVTRARRREQQVEQAFGISPAQNDRTTLLAEHSECVVAVFPDVGQADSVDPGGNQAIVTAGDDTRDVEKYLCHSNVVNGCFGWQTVAVQIITSVSSRTVMLGSVRKN